MQRNRVGPALAAEDRPRSTFSRRRVRADRSLRLRMMKHSGRRRAGRLSGRGMPNGASPLPVTVYAVSGAPRRSTPPASALPDGATPSPFGPAGTRRTATGQGAHRPIAARSARPYGLYPGTPGAEPTCSGRENAWPAHMRERGNGTRSWPSIRPAHTTAEAVQPTGAAIT
jgi:hypothetical protein